MSLQQAAELLGSTPVRVLQIENGENSISSARLLQTIVSLGGTIAITAKDGTDIPLEVPPLTEDQIVYRLQQREESLRQEEAKKRIIENHNMAKKENVTSIGPNKKRH